MELINHNVVFLESVNFCNYYKNIVTEALTSAGDIFSNISRSINDFSSLPNLAMREILLYYTDIIFDSIVNTNLYMGGVAGPSVAKMTVLSSSQGTSALNLFNK